jgi:hypothetical protein
VQEGRGAIGEDRDDPQAKFTTTIRKRKTI